VHHCCHATGRNTLRLEGIGCSQEALVRTGGSGRLYRFASD